MFNGTNLIGALTLLLLSASLWNVGSIGADYVANKAEAVAAHERCLVNVKKQSEPPSRGGVWPCWHSQLALSAYKKDWSLLTALAPANDHPRGLYLTTLMALLLWGVAPLKQR